MPNHHHRAGGLKQSNKKNKRGTASKRSVKRAAGGRLQGGASASIARLAAQSKANRRNTAQQRRDAKRQALRQSSRNGANASAPPPRVVGLLSLSEDAERVQTRLLEALVADADHVVWHSTNDKDEPTVNNKNVTCHYAVHKKQGSLTLIPAVRTTGVDAVQAAMDLTRICDVLLVLVDATRDGSSQMPPSEIGGNTSTTGASTTTQDWDELISAEGDAILTAMKAQGMPTPVTVLLNDDMSSDEYDDDEDEDELMTMVSRKSIRRSRTKRALDLKRYVSRFATTEFGNGHDRVMQVKLSSSTHGEEEEDGMEANVQQPTDARSVLTIAQQQSPTTLLVRMLCTMACSPAKWVSQAARPYLVADSYHYDPQQETLSLTGHVRGSTPWNVHHTVHVPGLESFSCATIEAVLDPLTKVMRKHLLSVPLAQQQPVSPDEELLEPLERFATPDSLQGEQNLIGFDPADALEEEPEEEEPFARPAGWSDYQSAWLDALDNDDAASTAANQQDHGELAQALNQKSVTTAAPSSTADAMDLEDANQVSSAERQALQEERRKEQKEHEEFPDEVQVAEDVNARDRFARYRALKSFRKSYWDPKENLPETFSSLFNFASFKGTQRSVMNELKQVVRAADRAEGQFWGESPKTQDKETMTTESDDEEDDLLEGCVPSGSYVKITLSRVSPQVMKRFSKISVLTAVALLPHENKMSVLHAGLSRSLTASDAVLKSKDVVTVRCGWRSWETRPVFSQHNLNSDKHKLERYMPGTGAFFCASMLGPVTYTPCPVMVFKKTRGGESLVAVGSMLHADTDRIVVKRIVLTGFPVRVHKRTSVVKYMFHNPDDVEWFKPAGLYTKHGLNGHIVQSVGDHGTMKCLFHAPIKQHDTVCLPLYKRIFPKYAPVVGEDDEDDAMGQGTVATARPTIVIR